MTEVEIALYLTSIPIGINDRCTIVPGSATASIHCHSGPYCVYFVSVEVKRMHLITRVANRHEVKLVIKGLNS